MMVIDGDGYGDDTNCRFGHNHNYIDATNNVECQEGAEPVPPGRPPIYLSTQEDHLVANSDLPELTKLQEKLNLADFQKFPPLKVRQGVERGA